MIDKKKCKGCRFQAHTGDCLYRHITGKSRTAAGALTVCSVFEPKVDEGRRSGRFSAANPKRVAVKTMFQDGKSDAQIADEIEYPCETVQDIIAQLGLTRAAKTAEGIIL